MDIFWLITAIILLIIEVNAFMFVAIFFAFGAFITAALAWYGISLEWQIASFSISSLASLLLLRKFIVKKFNKDAPVRGDNHHLTHKHGVITKEISKTNEIGEVQVAGTFWQATSDVPLPLGERIIVLGRHADHDLILQVTSLP